MANAIVSWLQKFLQGTGRMPKTHLGDHPNFMRTMRDAQTGGTTTAPHPMSGAGYRTFPANMGNHVPTTHATPGDFNDMLGDTMINTQKQLLPNKGYKPNSQTGSVYTGEAQPHPASQ